MSSRSIRVASKPQVIAVAMAVAVMLGFLAFTLSAKAKPDSDETRYLNPREMVLSLDGRRLYVLCEASDEVRVVDTEYERNRKSHPRWPHSPGNFPISRRPTAIRSEFMGRHRVRR